ncbi:hypothetical protein AJ79_09239 [Helicocarpus griseus UAMH5409]|uniref:Protein kinase domain-containing protein n=1 Tax=Helicocarpus griseus UAMH5409 TaxID=1447875 RepID=A0A2B7WL98_9EURO|nr:hypothetical protein AJ79_09239 [Helicocarpus griseus UAMH5409]
MSNPFDTPLEPANTVYRDETGFDENYKIDIDFVEMKLIAVLKESEPSSIFHVSYFDKPRVLKVFHNGKDPGYAQDGVRDLNRTRCEIRAYCRLKRFKICDNGFAPKFYGYMLAINPTSWEPHLDAFQCDIGLPSAILIEYVPNPVPINCANYTQKRFEKVNMGIQQTHSALIEHNDPYPKNKLIVPGDPERVI